MITETVDEGSAAVFGLVFALWSFEFFADSGALHRTYAANSAEGKKRTSDLLLEKVLGKFLDVVQNVLDTPQQTKVRVVSV